MNCTYEFTLNEGIKSEDEFFLRDYKLKKKI